jgi:hypothetical protein
MLDNEGKFTFSKYLRKDNNYTVLENWKEEPAINLNLENNLRIIAKGDAIRLYINDKLVGDERDSSNSTGNINIVAWMDKDRTLTLDVLNFKLTLLQP